MDKPLDDFKPVGLLAYVITVHGLGSAIVKVWGVFSFVSDDVMQWIMGTISYFLFFFGFSLGSR